MADERNTSTGHLRDPAQALSRLTCVCSASFIDKSAMSLSTSLSMSSLFAPGLIRRAL